MKKIEKLVYTIIVMIITGMPLINFIRYCNYLVGNSFYKYIQQKYLIYFLLPILLIVYIYSVIKKHYKIKYSDIIIYILIILGIISTIFAIDIKKSIFGEVSRYEGLLALSFYYLLFLNAKNINNDKYKKNIFKVLIITTVIQVIYSILQVYTDFSFIMHFTMPYMALGTQGNPNFYGSYMVISTLITIVLYSLKGEYKYLILSIIFFWGLCLANSTGPILGFALAYLFFFIVFFKKIKLKKFLLLTIILLSMFFIVDNSVVFVHEKIFNNNIEDAYNVKKELYNSVTNINNGDLGNGRIRIWTNTIPIIKEYFLFGCGIDNFANVYPQPTGLIYDKAHNVYLQILVTNGIFALEVYCALCLTIFIKGFKQTNIVSIALFTSFVGYCIQAFANISVIDVAPIFYIVIGLLYTYMDNELF